MGPLLGYLVIASWGCAVVAIVAILVSAFRRVDDGAELGEERGQYLADSREPPPSAAAGIRIHVVRHRSTNQES